MVELSVGVLQMNVRQKSAEAIRLLSIIYRMANPCADPWQMQVVLDALLEEPNKGEAGLQFTVLLITGLLQFMEINVVGELALVEVEKVLG